jgi:hypothetical protein
MLVSGGFQKFAGIPPGISRIFESLMVQQISANRRKNRSIQVKVGINKSQNIFPDVWIVLKDDTEPFLHQIITLLRKGVKQ